MANTNTTPSGFVVSPNLGTAPIPTASGLPNFFRQLGDSAGETVFAREPGGRVVQFDLRELVPGGFSKFLPKSEQLFQARQEFKRLTGKNFGSLAQGNIVDIRQRDVQFGKGSFDDLRRRVISGGPEISSPAFTASATPEPGIDPVLAAFNQRMVAQSGISPDSSLTAASLKPSAGADFKTAPQPPEVSQPIAPLGPTSIDDFLSKDFQGDSQQASDFSLTAPEQRAQTFTEEIIEMQNRLLGESAFRTELEGEEDISGIKKTQADLAGRLKILQNEALAIPQILQEESLGRGRTVGGLAPLEIGRLRANAIQSLSVSALLEASQGRLTTAFDLIDRAVAAKFDPIREEIAVTRSNLGLIMQSPNFSVADKKRALEQQKDQDVRKRELDKEERNFRQIQGIGVNAAAAQAPSNILRQIENLMENPTDKNVIRATQLAATFLQEEPTPTRPSIRTITRNGRIIEQQLDPFTREVIGEVDLGEVGTDIDIDIEDVKYTPNQLKKLRAFGVDPEDKELADTLLFKGEAEFTKLKEQREVGLSPGFSFKGTFNSIWETAKDFVGFN